MSEPAETPKRIPLRKSIFVCIVLAIMFFFVGIIAMSFSGRAHAQVLPCSSQNNVLEYQDNPGNILYTGLDVEDLRVRLDSKYTLVQFKLGYSLAADSLLRFSKIIYLSDAAHEYSISFQGHSPNHYVAKLLGVVTWVEYGKQRTDMLPLAEICFTKK